MRLAQALEEKYDLVMFDARGHGLSSAPETGYAPEDHVTDLVGLVSALGLEKPVLGGHSMGAANVALAAATYPDLASCLILEDPPWRGEYDVMERANRVSAWLDDVVVKQSWTCEQIIADARPRAPTWADVEWEPWAEAKLQVSAAVFDWIDLGDPPDPWQDVVHRIACPALLITGDVALDAIVSPEIAREAVALCSNLQIAHVPKAGHSIRRDRFAMYLQAVADFLQETCS
jgi:pimeloyl-ACP methyl ester carboxylesterase